MCPNCFCCRCKCGSKKKKPSDKEKENAGEDTVLNDQPYRYLTVDEMKSLGDDSLPIDVTRDERSEAQVLSAPPTADHDSISPLHASYTLNLTNVAAPDNVDIGKVPLSFGFLVSFLVDARGGAMRGCRHSGVRLIVPPRRAAAPTRVTCRYLRKDKLPHPPPLMEGEALASRILELGPVGAKFLGPVMIEVPHFASLRGTEREIVILRSDNGEAWREHTVEANEEIVQEILGHSFEKEDMPPPVDADPSRLTRILTVDFPHYFAVVSRVKQEVHAIGPEGGMVSSSVVPQVQAVFPQGALTKKIKVGLQAQPIPTDITAKLLGNRVAVSPIVTIEPRRRKFHKPITLTIPVPQAANKGMINQYSGDAPTLRLLCSITGGTARAQWEDVTGTTPLTFVKDCVSFTTTVSARFWLMDCRNVQDSAKMATELYREAIHVPFLAKFVVFAKRIEQLEARLRVFCMTDDKEDKTLEHQEHFTEVAKSRDVEVLEGKSQFVEFSGNLVPVTKSGDQLRLGFRAFRENRLPFTVRVKDPHADVIGRTLFMKEPKVSKGEAPQQPICVLNIVLPEEIIPETTVPDSELTRYQYLTDSRGLESYHRTGLRLSDISNLLENDWLPLASNLGISNSDVSKIQADHPDNEAQQAMAMLKLWMKQSSNRPSAATLESALVIVGREDIVRKCIYSDDQSSHPSSEVQDYPDSTSTVFRTTEFVQVPRASISNVKNNLSDGELPDHTDHGVLNYEMKESNIIEEPSKPVAEHRREIEKRLSQERSASLEKPEKKSEEPIMRTKISEHVALTETMTTDEPELSFHDKRLSFERVGSQDRAKTNSFIQEEKKSAVITSPPIDTVEAKVDEAAKLSFKEKRKSFEQGSLDKPDKDDKKPKSDNKKADGKIPDIGYAPKSVPEYEKLADRKVVSETISKTVEMIGDQKSIISEKVITTEINSDQKPITTEVVTTTIQTAGVEKPVVSKTTTKTVEETDTVSVSGAKDTVDKSVSKPILKETTVTIDSNLSDETKANVETSKTKPVVKETISNVKVESKPLDEIIAPMGTPEGQTVVRETITTVLTDGQTTEEITEVETSKKKPVISENITTVITDSKPTVCTKEKPVVSEIITTVIPDVKPTHKADKGELVVSENITSTTIDRKPADQAKTAVEIIETKSKGIESNISSTKDKEDKFVSENTTSTDVKPSDQTKTTIETSKPLTSEVITSVKTDDNEPTDSKRITSVTTAGKPTKELETTVSKDLAPAIKSKDLVEEQLIIKEVVRKDSKDKISRDKSPGDIQDILKDGIRTTESRVISEIVTTRTTEGAPSETRTVTEITTKSSDSEKPDQHTTITEINVGKPNMSLEERRKSELFEGVTQGLLANVKCQEPKTNDIISPKLINTPPPSPADFKDATSVSTPPTEPSWTSSTTLTDKTAIFIESERGLRPTDKPLQDSHEESKTSTSKLKDQSESIVRIKHDAEPANLENIEDDNKSEGNNEEPTGEKKGKRKRNRSKGKKNQNNTIHEKETEIKTEIHSEIDISVDEKPLIISENINIIENIVDKKDKKKNKKEKKESKGISHELLNATNIATRMILNDTDEPKKMCTSEMIGNEKKLEPMGQNRISSLNENNVLNTEMVNVPPIITEVIPKKLEGVSEKIKADSSPSTSHQDSFSINVDRNRDYVQTSITDSNDFLDPLKSKRELNIRETVIIEPYKELSEDHIDNSKKNKDTNLEPTKNHICVKEDSQNMINNKQNTDNNKSAVPFFKDSVVLNSSDYNVDSSPSLAFLTCDKMSTEIPEIFLGPSEISKINTSVLPDIMSGKVSSEKITPENTDIINGNSKVTVENISTQVPNEITGISKITTEKITTEIPYNADGVSKIITEKITTDLNNIDEDSQNKPSYSDEKNNTEHVYSTNIIATPFECTKNRNNFQSAAEEEELTNLEETNELSSDRFNDIIKNLSTSSREDIEQLLAGTLSQDPGTQDEKLTNLLIDMLIEQETMKLAASGDLPEVVDSEGSDLEGTSSTNQTSTMSENSIIDLNIKAENSSHKADENVQLQNKSDKLLRTMTKENSEPVFTTLIDMSEETSGAEGNVSPKPYVTTPTLSRRGIGGSQRYSREERPMLIEITKRYTSSSDEENENDTKESSQYVVTEPSPTLIKRKVTFKFDSEDPMSDEQDEDERVHFEIVGEAKKEKKRENTLPYNVQCSRSPSFESTSSKRNSIEIPKCDDLKSVEKVERKFERMASETLEDNSLAKGAVEGEFHRLTSQLSHEEMDECLMIWNESDLVPIGEKSEDVEFDDDIEDDGEFETQEEPSSSQGSRKKKEESTEVDIKAKSSDASKK